VSEESLTLEYLRGSKMNGVGYWESGSSGRAQVQTSVPPRKKKIIIKQAVG
jgi:hypothetical protein